MKINLSNGRMCKVDECWSFLEIYIYEAGENEALCRISRNADNCSKFTFKENLEDCIDEISKFVALTEEDKKQIEDLLEIPLYNVSFGTDDLNLLADIRTALEWVWEGGTINYYIDDQRYFYRHYYSGPYFNRYYYGGLYIMEDCELEEMYEIAKKEDETTPDNIDDYAKELCRNALMEAFEDEEIVEAGMDWDHPDYPERFKEMLMNLKKEILEEAC